jgi:serine/threonine protein kinase
MGLTHTDLKTENIMIADDGSTKLIDFGGATPDNEVRVHLINTLQYRAPEVILGCY